MLSHYYSHYYSAQGPFFPYFCRGGRKNSVPRTHVYPKRFNGLWNLRSAILLCSFFLFLFIIFFFKLLLSRAFFSPYIILPLGAHSFAGFLYPQSVFFFFRILITLYRMNFPRFRSNIIFRSFSSSIYDFRSLRTCSSFSSSPLFSVISVLASILLEVNAPSPRKKGRGWEEESEREK